MGKVEDFVNYIAPIIVNEGKSRGYSVFSVTIAQAIKEGGSGQSSLAKLYHNHFGMKTGSSWKGKKVTLKTKEEYKKGVLTTIYADFRAYDNDVEGIKGYYDFLQMKRFQNLKTAKNYKEFAHLISVDGWATSKTYEESLIHDYVEKYNLQRFDSGAVPTPTPTTPESYHVGSTYTTNVDLYVRLTPRGEKKLYSELSANAKKNGFADSEGYGILKKGTRVTCRALVKMNGQIWIQIPSGWICAINVKNQIYVE